MSVEKQIVNRQRRLDELDAAIAALQSEMARVAEELEALTESE